MFFKNADNIYYVTILFSSYVACCTSFDEDKTSRATDSSSDASKPCGQQRSGCGGRRCWDGPFAAVSPRCHGDRREVAGPRHVAVAGAWLPATLHSQPISALLPGDALSEGTRPVESVCEHSTLRTRLVSCLRTTPLIVFKMAAQGLQRCRYWYRYRWYWNQFADIDTDPRYRRYNDTEFFLDN